MKTVEEAFNGNCTRLGGCDGCGETGHTCKQLYTESWNARQPEIDSLQDQIKKLQDKLHNAILGKEQMIVSYESEIERLSGDVLSCPDEIIVNGKKYVPSQELTRPQKELYKFMVGEEYKSCHNCRFIEGRGTDCNPGAMHTTMGVCKSWRALG